MYSKTKGKMKVFNCKTFLFFPFLFQFTIKQINKMKVLVYTSSFDRPKMLRSCIQDCQAQSYQDILHVINLTSDSNNQLPVIDDLIDEKTKVVRYANSHSHINNMNAIKWIPDCLNYDLFVKFDDDDIHKKDYVKNIVDHFIKHPECDIVSTLISNQLNGTTVYPGTYDNLGGNPEGSNYHMPMSFAFNKKALLSIINLTDLYHHDDFIWRQKWQKDGLIHQTVDNQEQIIWYIHGKNISTANFLK